MKKFIALIALASIVGWCGVSFAATCPVGQRLRKIGNAQTDDAVITTAGADVQLIVVSCSGTACTAGFFNADTLGSAADTNLTLEVGGGASTTITINLTDTSGISFDEGITFVDDANTAAVTLYACQP